MVYPYRFHLRQLAVLSLITLALAGTLTTVYAAAPSISPPSQTLPFGQTSITVTFDTGDGSPGSVFFQFNKSGERLLVQGASGSIPVDFIKQSGDYVFTLYKGIYSSSPAAQGVPVAAQTVQHKVNPDGIVGADIRVVKANADGSAPTPSGPVSGCSGQFGGYSFGTGCQILTPDNAGPTFANPLTLDRYTTYPRRVYVAFDASSLPSGAVRDAVSITVTPPNGSPVLFAQGSVGLLQFDYIVNGHYIFTLSDAATGGNLSTAAFDMTRGVLPDNSTYTGGTAATVRYAFQVGSTSGAGFKPSPSDVGGPALVCVSNNGAGASAQFANNGTIAGYSNGGGGNGTITGLNTSGTPYVLTVYRVTFSSGPQFITSVTATGPNCGDANGAGVALSNGTSATATMGGGFVNGDPASRFTINP